MEIYENSFVECKNIYSNVRNVEDASQESTSPKGKMPSLKTVLLIVSLVVAIALTCTTIALLAKTAELEVMQQKSISKLKLMMSKHNETSMLKANQNTLNELELRLEIAENKSENQLRKLKEEMDHLQNLSSSNKETVYPHSCSDVQPRDDKKLYVLYPLKWTKTTFLAVCDVHSDGGGWLIVQRRTGGSEDFYRGWNDYVNGFGSLMGEFWTSLNTLHKLTSQSKYELRFDMEDFNNQTAYAKYKTFSVGSGPGYILTVSGYSGTAGDSLSGHSGQKFSSKDKDQDSYSGGSCASMYKGGWWYESCHSSNPNGLYLRGNHSSHADGVNWRTFRGYHYSLKSIEMKIREI